MEIEFAARFSGFKSFAEATSVIWMGLAKEHRMKTLSVVGAVMITLVELGLYGYYTIRFDGFTSCQTIA